MNFFKKQFQKLRGKFKYWKELGSYRSIFSRFGTDMYSSELVRSCIRPLAEHSSKANVKCSDKRIEFLINYKPNMYMSGHDLLYKVRTWLEIYNTAFILISRDDKGKANEFYPVPYSQVEALNYNEQLFIDFSFANGERLVAPWDDLIVLRKDYNKYDTIGDDNTAILNTLEYINTINQGIANAVKSTSNLRGLLKNTKAMIDDDDTKKSRDEFVNNYLSLANEGGIAALDATQEFIPIKMEPVVANFTQMKEFRENVYRYFGVNDSIIMSDYTEAQMEAFYESRIEPFLVALSLEFTRKVFTDRQLGFENYIMFESNRLQYTSTTTKLALVALVDRGAMTPNEWRDAFNMAPIDGGDKPIRRLDTAEVTTDNTDDDKKKKEGSEDKDGKNTTE